jgi:hypothetical protein
MAGYVRGLDAGGVGVPLLFPRLSCSRRSPSSRPRPPIPTPRAVARGSGWGCGGGGGGGQQVS